jgi:prolipoprotein diacylglyceryltransferase
MIFSMITEPLLGTFITPYALILSLSAVAGLAITIWLFREEKILLLDTGIAVLAVSLLGARSGYIIQNYSYFIENLIKIPQFWLGGLSWPGGLLGSVVALTAIHLIWKEPLGEMADRLLPLFGMMVVAVWLTGWGAGIGYGPVTDSWIGIPVRDQVGLLTWRWPLPILGALISAGWVVGAILFPLKKNHNAGSRALIAVIGVTGINFICSIFRVDPAPIFLGLRWESWFSVLFVVAGIIGLIINRDSEEI